MKTTPTNGRGRTLTPALSQSIGRGSGQRGTILILVVVLLVLLALIGTAYLSSTAIERFSTAQQGDITEGELMLEGAVAVTKKLIIEGVIDGANYRTGANYPRYTMAGSETSAYLADRIPSLTGGGIVNWKAISMPRITPGAYTFETPDGKSLTFKARDLASSPPNALIMVDGGVDRIVSGFRPTTTTVNGKVVPALELLDGNGVLFSPEVKYVAADADGDGVADSLLVRISPAPIGGVTYYMGIRVIDAAAAVNAGTAGSRMADIVPGTSLDPADSLGRPTGAPRNLGMYASHIGLLEWIGTTEFSRLRKFRNGFNPLVPPDTNERANPTAIDDLGVARPDFAFLTQGQAWEFMLARRLRNPGYYNASGQRYRGFGMDVAAALAYGGGLMMHPELNPTILDTILATSAQTWNAGKPTAHFPTSDAGVTDWYTYYYQDVGVSSIRPLLTAFNPVTNQMPVSGTLPNPLMIPYVGFTATSAPYYAPRVNINTASFGELWWGFYQVMADAPGIATGANTFRSPTRDPANNAIRKLTGLDTAQLRAAIAAVNAEDLRDADYNVTARTIRLTDPANPANSTWECNVYGHEPAPFITEVYVDNNRRPLPSGSSNTGGYIAIELHNPYDFDICLDGYNLGIVNRRATLAAGEYASTTPNWLYFLDNTTDEGIKGFPGFPFNGSVVVPRGGYLVLENYNGGVAGDDAALERPFTGGLTAPGAKTKYVYVKNLHRVLRNDNPAASAPGEKCPGGELYLLRPRTAGMDMGTGQMRCPYLVNSTMAVPGPMLPVGQAFDEANLEDLIPVDSVDFSTIFQMVKDVPTPPVLDEARRWHGTRRNDTSAAGPKWKFVFSGPYRTAIASPEMREKYIRHVSVYEPKSTDPLFDATTLLPPMNLGGSDPDTAVQENRYPPVQMSPSAADFTSQFAGPNKPAASGNRFPFGGFARDGDILQVPFAGAYIIRRVTTAGGTLPVDPTAGAPAARKLFLEMNSLPKDLVFARWDEPAADAAEEHEAEQLGRFCPMRFPVEFGTGQAIINDFDPEAGAHGASHRYRWAADLFEYLTVNSPASDKLPDISPYTTVTGATVTPAPRDVANADPSRVNNGLENLVGIEGKININTAPWRVLATLPLAHDPANNEAVAKAIVRFREQNGPFRSIMELNRVTNDDPSPGGLLMRSFRSGWRLPYDPADPNNSDRESADPDDNDGDFSPYNGAGAAAPAAPDGVTKDPDTGTVVHGNWDFERQFLQVTRISNLITVRSDTFNCYVIMQGWRNVELGTPELAVQRRAAFIADRTGTTLANKKLNVIGVPAN